MNAFDAGFSWLQLGLGAVLAAIIALGAYKLRSLAPSGAWGAFILGTLIFGLGGLSWAALLLTFFISSSLLSRLFKRQKAGVNEKFSKGSTRDAGQVLANGGAAGLAVILQAIWPQAGWLWIAGAAALAAANADTWATELGVLSRSDPRLITSGARVEKGTSGGISLAGLAAALSGSALVALAALFFWPEYAGLPGAAFLPRLVLISLAGLAGSLVDSWLGATVQAIYYCPVCQKETERYPQHACGAATTLKRGLPWLDNDWVNTACTLSAGLIGGLAAALLSGALLLAPLPAVQANGMQFSAPAFADGAPIPVEYTCDGANIAPALSWSAAPQDTASFALVVSDPDAPGGTFIHWLLYNLPAESTSLPSGLTAANAPTGAQQGKNGFGDFAYGGPCPPAGSLHHYQFTLYALDLAPSLDPGLSASALQLAIHGHILAQSQWTGVFSH